MDDGTVNVNYTQDEKTANIISFDGINGIVQDVEIFWANEGAIVDDRTIKVNDVNNPNMTITPSIIISCGDVNNVNAAISNTVDISNVTFIDSALIYGGYSGNPGSGEERMYAVNTNSNGTVTDNTVTDNTVTIKNTTFTSTSNIYDGYISGNAAVTGNKVEISGNTKFDSTSFIYGGYSASGTAEGNSVSISDSNFKGDVYGGYSASDTANYNKVIISGDKFNGYVYGGHGNTAANNNSVIISGGTINGSVYGGYSEAFSDTANYNNKVILVGGHAKYPLSAEQTLTGSGDIKINGTVYGSNLHNSTPSNNEIHVYGSNTEVYKIESFKTLRFFIDDTLTFGETMLTIKGYNNDNTDVTISNDNLAVKVTGKPKASNDNTNNTITLIHNESTRITYSNDITLVPVEIGRLLTGEGSVALVDNANNNKDLVLTLKNITVNENGKSLVETRAAAAFVVNNMSDFMLGTGMEQAKAAAGGVTPIDAGTMAPFAAVGGSNMRYTTGSYVDVNGWNGAVGFAKQADKLLFGVAVEHGRGNYDSYLDSGVHASGDIKSTGGVIFGEYKLDNGVHYDAALRAGRVKSDYSSTATSYDESSAYYGFSLGGGKELTVSDKATLDVYGRYYFSHTNGSDVSIATGEAIDFDAVNSHRLRIGGRYTTTLTEKSKAYAGLAWQYEFGGDAKAAINGYSAPTPSLQGHSAIVEAGYKLNAGKNLTLDFNLNGAMGKQRGIGGGIGAQWLF